MEILDDLGVVRYHHPQYPSESENKTNKESAYAMRKAISDSSLVRYSDVLPLLLSRFTLKNVVFESDNDLNTPLHIAAKHGHLDIVIFLLEHDVFINTTNVYLETPLHLAAQGSVEIVQLLLKTKAKFTADRCGLTPLHRAVQCGSTESVKLLLEHGADTMAKDVWGNTALHFAASFGKNDLLFKCHPKFSYSQQSFVTHAQKFNMQQGKTSLDSFERNTSVYYDIVALLLSRGANVSDENRAGNSAIDIAAVCNGELMLKTLLKQQAGEVVLQCSVSQEEKLPSVSTAELKSIGGDGAKKLDYRLLFVNYIKLNYIRLLLMFGADISAIDRDGNTIHMLIGITSSMSISNLLSETQEFQDCIRQQVDMFLYGVDTYFTILNISVRKSCIDINARNHAGQTAVTQARSINNQYLLNKLVELVGDLNAYNMHGATALHLAARLNNYVVVKLLLKAGACVNSSDFQGNKALHYAMQHSRSTLIGSLLLHGAQVNERNKAGETVFHLAVDNRRTDVIDAISSSYVNDGLRKNKMFTFRMPDCFTCALCAKRETKRMSKFSKSLSLHKHDYFELPSENFLENWYRHICERRQIYKEAINLCHCYDIEKFDQHTYTKRDPRGRSMLHLCILQKIQNSHYMEYYREESSTLLNNVLNQLTISKNVDIQDCQGRTPLHYFAKSKNLTVTFRDYRRNLLTDCSRMCLDAYGRPPLYYAVKIKDHIRMCGKNEDDTLGRDLNVVDIYDTTAAQLRQRYDMYKSAQGISIAVTSELKNSCRSLQNVEWIVNNEICPKAYSAENIIVKSSVRQETICSNIPKYWRELKYVFRGTVVSMISNHLMAFMERLAHALKTRDSLFECQVVNVGSAYEGTKIKYPKEFDLNFVLTTFSSLYEPTTSPACSPGFVHLQRNKINMYKSCPSKTLVYCRTNEKDFQFKFKEKKYLDTCAVRRTFERLIKDVLRDVEFLRSKTFFEVHIDNDKELYLIKSNKLCIILKFVVNRPLNGIHVFHKISVDIVPTIEITDYWPEGAIQDVSQDMKSNECYLVFDEPYKLYPWISSDAAPYARISFGQAESDLIRNAPPVIKAAFMVSKQIATAFGKADNFTQIQEL